MKILVNCQSGMGINILAVPSLRAIKRRYPDSYVHLIVQFKSGASLLENCPYFDEISVLNYQTAGSPLSLFKFLKILRKTEYDYSFMLFPGNRIDKNVFHRLVRARKRVSFDYTYRKYLNLNFLNDIRIPIDHDLHDVEQNLNLLSTIGVDPGEESVELELFLPAEAKKRAEAYLESSGTVKRIVGIHAGSSKDLTMELKRWPSEYFASLADSLKERYDCEIFLFGSRDEDTIKMNIRDKMNFDCTIVGEMDIQTTAALIGKCSLFISNDSGLMHIAAAVGVKTVGIFGPTDPKRTAPWGKEHIVVRNALSCSPCFSIRTVGKKIRCSEQERKCLLELKPDGVLRRIEGDIDTLLTDRVGVDAHHE